MLLSMMPVAAHHKRHRTIINFTIEAVMDMFYFTYMPQIPGCGKAECIDCIMHPVVILHMYLCLQGHVVSSRLEPSLSISGHEL